VRTAPRAPRDAFTGPMAVLVDATTQGEGELIALRLLAGGLSRVLVGTPTAGAVGDVATLRLPGQVQVTFPVHEVRHPDGAFVQRLGLTPSLAVTPTVTAVRNGRDEALEAAQRWIAQQLAPPPGRRR
jgi:C-terminal processing protease CtpA/Prc